VAPAADAGTVPATSRFFVMLGGPGAGKGTQAPRVAGMLGLSHVASGDLFRAALRDGTPLGREAKAYIDRGALVPDDVTVRMIAARLDEPDAAAGVILDGFPRTVPQARALDALLARRGAGVSGALYIDVSQDELVRRMSGRWTCRGEGQHIYHEITAPPRVPGICDIDGEELFQRPDDDPSTVRARLEQQMPPMYEVVDHYAEQGVLIAVPGERPMDQVTDDLLAAIERQVR
jgi:adenylate kinase